jgi:branched-chain amino acid transport system permease protein
VWLGLLVWLLLTRTRAGTLVRAATQDREMVSALGVNQARPSRGVRARRLLALAGRRGAAAARATRSRWTSTPSRRLRGGGGAAWARTLSRGRALLIAEVKAICIWLGVVA